MERNSNQESLGEVIRKLIDSYGLQNKLSEVQLVKAWEEVVGASIARHTTEIYVKNGTLFLRLDSSVLREELSYGKDRILELVNGFAGRTWVTEVVIR
ncbi:MAG: DUF721 domain-containing protein [Salibacteraceae bacterium]